MFVANCFISASRRNGGGGGGGGEDCEAGWMLADGQRGPTVVVSPHEHAARPTHKKKSKRAIKSKRDNNTSPVKVKIRQRLNKLSKYNSPRARERKKTKKKKGEREGHKDGSHCQVTANKTEQEKHISQEKTLRISTRVRPSTCVGTHRHTE